LRDEWKRLNDLASTNGCLKCGNELHNKFHCSKHVKSKLKLNFPLSLPKLRPLLMKSDKDLDDNELWIKDTPYDTRQLVIKELIGNIKSAISNKRNGHIKHFNMEMRTKKNPKQVFHVDKNAIKNLEIFRQRLKFKRNITVKT